MIRFAHISSRFALAAMIFIGCSDPAATNNPSEPSDPSLIGSAGGKVETSGGASVTVPAGALDEDVEIAVEVVSEGELAAGSPTGASLAGEPQRFLPHGTSFQSPVTITLPHDGSATGALRLDDESDTSWEAVDAVEIDETRITFEASSFSVYAAIRAESSAMDAGVPDGGSVDVGGEVDAGTDGGTPDAATDAATTDTGSACTPLSPSAPTGSTDASGTFADASTWTAVDAVAAIKEGAGEQGLSTILAIHLTDHADACALQEAGQIDPNAFHFELRVVEQSPDSQPGLPAPGTYTYSTDTPVGMPLFTGAGPLWGTDDPQANPDGGCTFETAIGSGGAAGTLTLDAVSETEVSGSFEFTDGDGGTHGGTFTAPVCATGSELYDGCCYSP